MSAVRDILVRGPNWTGDLVMSTPGFRALRARFPAARIALHVRPGLEPLVAGAPWFDRVIPVRSYQRGLAAIWREGATLRSGGRFDLGICLPDSFSSALLMRVARVRRIVGYRRGGRGALLHQPVAPPSEWGRRTLVARERFVLGLVEAAGCPELGHHTELFTTAAEEERAEALLEGQGVGSGAPIAAVAPGASYGPSKLWPAESFARVADAAADGGAQVVIVGAPSERELSVRVESAMRTESANLTGALDLGSLKAVLRRSDVLVCNDAGARHVAVAFGVPCVVLMGPTAIEKTNLNLANVRVIDTEVDCRPCYLRECPIDHRCMTRIAPARVIEAVREALARAKAVPGCGAG